MTHGRGMGGKLPIPWTLTSGGSDSENDRPPLIYDMENQMTDRAGEVKDG